MDAHSTPMARRADRWAQQRHRWGVLPHLLALVLVVVVITLAVCTQVQRTLVQGALQQRAAFLAGLVQGVLGAQIPAAHLRVAAQPAQRAWWATRVQHLRRIDPAVGQIAVWDPTGRCIYATDPHQIGRITPHDPPVHLALQGQPTAALEQERAAPVPGQSGERGRAPTTHLATYMPLPGPQGPRGAYEVDSVAAPLTRQIAAAQHRVEVILGASATLLTVALCAMLWCARGALVRQERAGARAEAFASRAAHAQMNRLSDAVLAGVSPALRQPLTTMQDYSVALRAPDVLDAPAALRACLEVIVAEADRLDGLIDQLLDPVRREGTAQDAESADAETASGS